MFTFEQTIGWDKLIKKMNILKRAEINERENKHTKRKSVKARIFTVVLNLWTDGQNKLLVTD